MTFHLDGKVFHCEEDNFFFVLDQFDTGNQVILNWLHGAALTMKNKLHFTLVSLNPLRSAYLPSDLLVICIVRFKVMI